VIKTALAVTDADSLKGSTCRPS